MTSHWNRIEVLYGCAVAEVLLAFSFFAIALLIFRRAHHPLWATVAGTVLLLSTAFLSVLYLTVALPNQPRDRAPYALEEKPMAHVTYSDPKHAVHSVDEHREGPLLLYLWDPRDGGAHAAFELFGSMERDLKTKGISVLALEAVPVPSSEPFVSAAAPDRALKIVEVPENLSPEGMGHSFTFVIDRNGIVVRSFAYDPDKASLEQALDRLR